MTATAQVKAIRKFVERQNTVALKAQRQAYNAGRKQQNLISYGAGQAFSVVLAELDPLARPVRRRR